MATKSADGSDSDTDRFITMQMHMDSMAECPVCDRRFETKNGLQSHFGYKHPDRNLTLEQVGEERLRLMYLDQQMSENRVAKEIDGVTRNGIRGALQHLGIRRGQSEAEKVKNAQMTEEERREQTRAARERNLDLYGDGGFIGVWAEENPETHRQIAQAAAPLGAAGRERNGMAGVTGQDNPNWRGGKSIYDAVRKQLPGPSWTTLRERTREAAGGECEMCGRSAEEIEHRDLDVHHVVPLLCGGTNEEWNRLALCPSCHNRAEWFTRNIPEIEPVLVA